MVELPDSRVPASRRRLLGDGKWKSDGRYVLYWMIANRRTRSNFALERAVELANHWERPLVIFEPLRCDYRWANDRHHRFIIEGMQDNAAALADTPAMYYPYVEPHREASRGLLAALAEHACGIVVDDSHMFFLPRMVQMAVRHVDAAFEAVDSTGIMPVLSANKVFARAYDFRRYVQREVRSHLDVMPLGEPLGEASFPSEPALDDVSETWPVAVCEDLLREEGLCEIEIDHGVRPVAGLRGGSEAAAELLQRFMEERLDRYDDDRNAMDDECSSNLSPYLHYGHIGSHDVFEQLINGCDWNPDDVGDKASGKREGWWKLPSGVEAFLDQLICWRELGHNAAAMMPNYMQYKTLPDWAKKTLDDHRGDARDPCYSLEEFDQAETHDDIWNAAQRQLVREGRIHNYLRMLWGKKILHWSESPEQALRIMIELNNRYALDGRDPNSYSGIFWCLGRYDRAWGPERPVFGKIRYMTSDSTRRKLSLGNYLRHFGKLDKQQSLFGED